MLNRALQTVVADVVRANAEQEVGCVGSTVWAAMLRGSMVDAINDTGVELREDLLEELEGVIGAIVVATKGKHKIVQLFCDETAFEDAWDATAAQYA